MGRLLVFGTSHAVAPARLRDGLYMDEESVVEFLSGLGAVAAVDEAALLHTCTRLEVYLRCADVDEAEAAVVGRLASGDAARREDVERHSYALTDDDAARHLLRVAAGLDSIVLGEPQILGQVRDAARIAAEVGATGPLLRRLFMTAVRAGKRARTETDLARGPTSLAAAAVRLALQATDDFRRQTVLVIGAGETAALTARHVAKRGPRRLIVANRSPEPAARLAAELAGETATLDELAAHVRDAGIVIAATGAPEPILDAEDLRTAMAGRDGRPLVIVDLGRPRNVAPPTAPIDGLTVHDLDGLAKTVERNRDRQAAEIPRVESIVEEEFDRFRQWRRGREVLPHLRALRRHFFDLGRRELESQAGGLEGGDREALEAYTRRLISRLLHEPTVRIKQTDRETAEGLARLEAVETLFDLDV